MPPRKPCIERMTPPPSGIDTDWEYKANHWEKEAKRLIVENNTLKNELLLSDPSVTDARVEAATRAIYEHRPYLNHSGKSHMAWSVFKRELGDEYERMKVAVRIGLEAAKVTAPSSWEAAFIEGVKAALAVYAEGEHNGETWDYFGAAHDAMFRLIFDVQFRAKRGESS